MRRTSPKQPPGPPTGCRGDDAGRNRQTRKMWCVSRPEGASIVPLTYTRDQMCSPSPLYLCHLPIVVFAPRQWPVVAAHVAALEREGPVRVRVKSVEVGFILRLRVECAPTLEIAPPLSPKKTTKVFSHMPGLSGASSCTSIIGRVTTVDQSPRAHGGGYISQRSVREGLNNIREVNWRFETCRDHSPPWRACAVAREWVCPKHS